MLACISRRGISGISYRRFGTDQRENAAWIGNLIDVNPPVWLQSVRIPNLVLLLLVIACGLIAARLTWSWVVPPPFLPAASNPNPGTTAGAAINSDADLGQVGRWALFGRPKSSEQPIDTVQSSSLGVRLEGIISGTTPPLVMLGVGNAVKLLQVGSEVSPNVVVHAIEPDRVILANQGRLEAIRFPKPAALNTAPSPVPANLLASGSETDILSESDTPPPTRQSILQNPQSLMQYVRLVPENQGGQLRGFVLHAVPGQGAMLGRLGLMDGDVLTEADGRPVTDGNLLPHLMPLLRSGQSIPVTIERQGRPMHLTLNLDALR